MTRRRIPVSRLALAARIVAAVIGGYAVVSLITIAVPLLFSSAGTGRPQLLMATTMASFPLYAVIILAVFHARSATRAWLWLAAVMLALSMICWLLLPGGRA